MQKIKSNISFSEYKKTTSETHLPQFHWGFYVDIENSTKVLNSLCNCDQCLKKSDANTNNTIDNNNNNNIKEGSNSSNYLFNFVFIVCTFAVSFIYFSYQL